MTTEARARLYRAQHEVEHDGRRPIVHNPHNKPVSELPAIYCFSNIVGGGDGIAYAMAEDGTVLGSHWCSHETYVPADLAVIDGWRMDRHETYRGHYPEGYRMEFIPAAESVNHEGLRRAYALNQEQAAKARADSEEPGAR